MTHGVGRPNFGPRQAGQGCCRPGKAGFGPGQGGFGFGQVGFRGEWPGRGVTGEKGSSYDQNAAGRGISAQYGAGQGEFWTGSSGFEENGVDSGGWRPSMARNWEGANTIWSGFWGKETKNAHFRRRGCLWMGVESYFAINGLSEREKLMAAALFLEGKALTLVSVVGTTTTIEAVG